MKKHIQIRDMTFEQLYLKMQQGEEFQLKLRNATLDSSAMLLWIDKSPTEATNTIMQKMKMGCVYSEVDWAYELDDTLDNGVYCICWDEENKKTIEKVVNIRDDKYETIHGWWNNAIPVPHSISSKLDELIKKPLT